jgi:hypothetical protein
MLSLCSDSVYLNWLFHDAVANPDYTPSDVRVMIERGISKDLEGSGRVLRNEYCRNFRRGTEDIHEYPWDRTRRLPYGSIERWSRYQQVGLWHVAAIPCKQIWVKDCYVGVPSAGKMKWLNYAARWLSELSRGPLSAVQ